VKNPGWFKAMTPHLVRSYKPASAVLVLTLAFAHPVKTKLGAVWAQSFPHKSMAGGSHHGHGHGRQSGQVVVNGTGTATGTGNATKEGIETLTGTGTASGAKTTQQSSQSDSDSDSPSELELGTQTNSQNKLTPNGFPASNEKTADHIEDEINRQRALDVNYRHAIAKDLIKNWQPKSGGYVAYLVGLSKAGKVIRLEQSASSGDAEAASKALKAIHFPPLPRGIQEITYAIDFKGIRTISIAQYSFTKAADEEKVPVNLQDAALEITERKPKPAATAADASKNASGTPAAGVAGATGSAGSAGSDNTTDTTSSGGAQSANSTAAAPNNGLQDATQIASGQPPASQSSLAQTQSMQPAATSGAPTSSSTQVNLSQAAGYKLAPPSLGSAQPIAAPPPPPSAKQQGQPAPADLLQYQKVLESQIASCIPSGQELSVWDLATTFGIHPNGKIKEQKIAKTSGSQKVDASVMHAVHLAAPAVNLTDTDNAQFQLKVVFNGIVDGKVVKDAQPICTVQLVNW
jgi:hypothetical protein